MNSSTPPCNHIGDGEVTTKGESRESVMSPDSPEEASGARVCCRPIPRDHQFHRREMGAARGHAFVGVAIGYEPVCELLLPLLKLEIKKENEVKEKSIV